MNRMASLLSGCLPLYSSKHVPNLDHFVKGCPLGYTFDSHSGEHVDVAILLYISMVRVENLAKYATTAQILFTKA